MDEFGSNELNTFMQAIKSIAELPDEIIESEEFKNTLEKSVTPELKEQSINQIVSNLDSQRATREDAKKAMEAMKSLLNELVYDQTYTPIKKKIIDEVMNTIISIFDEAATRYHLYNFELPMQLSDGAQPPTYAHETDAAADIYAKEDQIIPAHSYSNMIKTGIKIQLPEGWLAFILPRSSIGLKTPLRLSNSVGLIDSGYRGELGVIYDNTSDEDYQIHKGDRIAQLLVMPSYRFQAKVVDILVDSDRGEGGFGSTDK